MAEEQLIQLAIDRSQRQRFRDQLAQTKKRGRLLDSLNHRPPLEAQRTTWFSSFTKAAREVMVPANTSVLLLSASEELDGRTMPWAEAVEAVPMAGWGTLIGITPSVALYYGEGGERAAVIRSRD